MRIAPPGKRVDYQFANVIGDLLVILRGFYHFAADAFVCLGQSAKSPRQEHSHAHLPSTCAVIPRKAARHSVHGGRNVSQAITVQFFRIGPHTGNCQDLVVFDNALLEFLEQHP